MEEEVIEVGFGPVVAEAHLVVEEGFEVIAALEEVSLRPLHSIHTYF